MGAMASQITSPTITVFLPRLLRAPKLRGKSQITKAKLVHPGIKLTKTGALLTDNRSRSQPVPMSMSREAQSQYIETLQWRHNGRDGVSNHQPHWLGTGAVISEQCPGFCEFDTQMNQFCPGYLWVAPEFRSPQQTRQKNSNCISTGMAYIEVFWC